jgi:hypothetical protein
MAGPAGADPSGTYTCTATDANTSATVTQTGTYAEISAEAPPVLQGTSVGDVIDFSCSGFTAHEGIYVVPVGGLAGWDLNPANEEDYACIPCANLAGSADSSGDFTENFTTSFSNGDSNVTAPPSQVAENLGDPANIVGVVDSTTQDPLMELEVTYATGPAPQNPAISASQYLVSPSSTTAETVSTTSGYWWGAGELGTTGANPDSPIPDPTVTIDGTPIGSIGTGGGSTLQVSAASYAYGAPGTPTYAVLSGGVTVPSGLTPGVHVLSVTEGTQEETTLTASTDIFVSGTTGTSGTCPGGNLGPNTSVTCSGSTGWEYPTASTFTGEWIAPVGCVEGNQPATSLGAVGGGGTEAFTVNTSDLSGATFADPTCIPGSWTVDITQKVGGNTVATGTIGPFSLVDLTAVCSIASTGTCLVQQGLGQEVIGTDLTVTEYAATSGIGAPGQNPSAILVNLGAVTLGPGVFQAGQGELNTVEVNDSRGTLSGWTVTGILESDFIGPAVGNDNTIPADYLTWNPSVSLTFPGNLLPGVVPYGTVSPPVYGPDACVAGSASTGTNTNIKCPTLTGPSEDNATTTNPAGNTNNTVSPENHANDPLWPVTNAEGPSGLLNEIQAGPIANLGTSDAGAPDFGTEPAQVLCEAASGGGGGAFNCDASLSLAVPPYVAAGHYTATMDILTTAT